METLAVDPDAQLLEIGCGQEVAVSLVCEKLAGGTITAIDRSETMIAMAGNRNLEHVISGRAAFQPAALDAAASSSTRSSRSESACS